MAFSLVESASIPFSLTMNPRSFPLVTLKTYFCGLSLIGLSQSLEEFPQDRNMTFPGFRPNDHVVDIYLDFFVNEVVPDGCGGPLIGSPTFLSLNGMTV